LALIQKEIRIVKNKIGIALVMVLGLSGSAWAAQDKTNQAPQELRVELNLMDGSRIIGVPTIESVPIQTSYAKMVVPLKQVLAIKVDENHETASLDLRNGDKLKGVINMEPIKLETLFGKVSVGIEHIMDCRVLLAGGTLPDALKQGLVLYYPFDKDEGKRVTDASGKNNQGDVLGAKWTSKGKVGGAFRFGGRRERIEVADSKDFSLRLTEDKTYALWWKPEGDFQHKCLIAKWDLARNGLGMNLLTLSSEGAYYATFQTDHWAQYAVSFSRAEWNHATLVCKAGTWRMFHNAVECPIARNMGIPHSVDKTVNTPLEVGGTSVADYGFEGLIDELMIFDRALSDVEVKQLYDAQK
jgi:hypothetical protein